MRTSISTTFGGWTALRHTDRRVRQTPPGANAAELKLQLDADQGTAVALQFFATGRTMAAAEAVFDAMGASDTSGTRTSVDRCATKLERSVSA